MLPEFKVLLDIQGLPPHLYRTKQVARAIGTFGTFLGSLPQSNTANLSCWTAAVAVDKLERIPSELEVHVKGFGYVAAVHTRKWLRASLYSAADLTKQHPRYTKQHLDPSNRRPDSPDSELIHISARVLRDLCKDKDPATIPPEIRAMLTGASDSRAITMAQLKLLVGVYASEPEFSTEQATQGAMGQILGLDDIMQEGQNTLLQMAATGGQQHPRPHTILQGESQQPMTILQRSTPQKTNSDEDQNVRDSSDVRRSDMEGSAVRQAQTTGTRQKEGKGQKGGKDKQKQVMQHVGFSNLVSSRPNFKPSKRSKVQMPQGPISRQLLRGDSSRGRPNINRPTRKGVQLPPKPTSFKPLQVGRRGRPKKGGYGLPTQSDESANVHLSNEGFYEVAIEYDHRSLLASGCGLQIEDVNQALMKDNLQRRNAREDSNNMGMEEDEGPDVSFDPEVEDDLGSDEDLD